MDLLQEEEEEENEEEEKVSKVMSLAKATPPGPHL